MRCKQGLVILASIFLVACKQAQIDGPVAGGIVTVEELRTTAVVVSGETTFDEAWGSTVEGWDEFEPLVKRALLGITLLNTQEFDEETWYLMTVEGGDDYGSEGELASDQVFGGVHALLKGSRLDGQSTTLSPLTEAAYQSVKDDIGGLSDEQLQAALDELAPQLVGDVDENGSVDYADVLSWNRLLHNNPELLKAAAAPLDSLTQGMRDGASEAVLSERAAALFDGADSGAEAQTFFAAFVNDQISQRMCRSCHSTTGIAKSTRHIVTSGNSEAALAANVAMYTQLVAALGVEGVLNKASGQVPHTGGERLAFGSANYDIFEEFLELL